MISLYFFLGCNFFEVILLLSASFVACFDFLRFKKILFPFKPYSWAVGSYRIRVSQRIYNRKLYSSESLVYPSVGSTGAYATITDTLNILVLKLVLYY